jgi:hypothetical protein
MAESWRDQIRSQIRERMGALTHSGREYGRLEAALAETAPAKHPVGSPS